MNNTQRLRRVNAAIERLPLRERPLWRKRVAARIKQPRALTLVGDAAEPESKSEWDLQLANWLDGVYTVVSDRANEVRKDSMRAVSDAGYSLFPLAAVGIVVIVFMLVSKRQGGANG